MPFKIDDDDRGTIIFNEGADVNGKNGIRQKNCENNIKLMKRLYTKGEKEISEKIKDLNNKFLRRKK
jgi:hypothetical protein